MLQCSLPQNHFHACDAMSQEIRKRVQEKRERKLENQKKGEIVQKVYSMPVSYIHNMNKCIYCVTLVCGGSANNEILRL